MEKATYLPAFLELLQKSSDLEDLLEGSLRHIVDRFGFSFGLILLFRPVSRHAFYQPDGLEPALDPARTEALCVELEGIEDFAELLGGDSDKRFDLALDKMLGRQVMEYLLFPLVVQDGVVGLLGLCREGRPSLSEEERSFLSIMVRQIQMELTRELALEKERQLAREGASLLDIGRIITSDLEMCSVFAYLVEVSMDMTGVSRCIVGVLDSSGERLQMFFASDTESPAVTAFFSLEPTVEDMLEGGRMVLREGKSIVIENCQEDPLINNELARVLNLVSMLGVPMHYQGRIIGGILMDEPGQFHSFSDEDIRIMEGIAAFAAIAIENARLYRESREQQEGLSDLMLRLARTREDERSRISRELHDSMAQTLLEIIYRAEGLMGNDPDEHLLEELRGMLASSRASLSELRRIITDLRPSSVEVLGLARALANLLDRFAVTYQLQVDQDIEEGLELDSLYENSIFRMVQEALNNISRHASAGRVRVSLRREDDAIRLGISDDGAGFDPASATGRGGLGLQFMRERAEMMGGSFRIESAEGRGTTIRVEVPLGGPGPGGRD